jgi:hypothetical protein
MEVGELKTNFHEISSHNRVFQQPVNRQIPDMRFNPYSEALQWNLPRVLALFDSDKTSISYGQGDRYHWAWGLIDFGNGTFQGVAHGISRLWKHKLWPYNTPKELFIERIDSLFTGAENLMRKDGSLEEAFPNEGSFCVTALAAFDLLCTISLLGDDIDEAIEQRWLKIVEPMIAFLIKSDETHSIISNHLATAVAALTRWHQYTQDQASECRAEELLERILIHQSSEGWFKEYEGADPGYQSLCIYYLADAHKNRPDWKLLEPLRRSIQFIWYFAHPDGSFGGTYGSRCTRFYYPAGVLSLVDQIPEAKALAAGMGESISNQQVVTLSAIDEPNLVPMFNAYCWAAALVQEGHGEFKLEQEMALMLPAYSNVSFRKHFPKAGLIIDRGDSHYTIFSYHKGGVFYHFVKNELKMINAGVVVINNRGKFGSTQSWNGNNSIELDDERITVHAKFAAMPKQLPTPWKFLILRSLCVTLFRSSKMREWIKQLLVRLLITGVKQWSGSNKRTIYFGKELKLYDKTDVPLGCEIHSNVNDFVSIHMASQGYWQLQDEQVISGVRME